MKLIKEYIDKLPTDLVWDPYKFVKKNIHYLNPNCKDILLEDLTKFDFHNLYPHIILGLHNEGLIDKKWEADIKQLESFLENIKELKNVTREFIGKPYDQLQHSILGSYKEGRIHANGLYDRIKSPLVVEYLHLVYSDLIEKYGDNIVYIDCDMIISKGDIDITTIPSLRFDKSPVEYFYIENLKRYIIFSNGQLETKGLGKFTKDDLLQLIKSEIRSRRLNKIGL